MNVLNYTPNSLIRTNLKKINLHMQLNDNNNLKFNIIINY
jgi:hypothetical protein